jgi:hypothetical protein
MFYDAVQLEHLAGEQIKVGPAGYGGLAAALALE